MRPESLPATPAVSATRPRRAWLLLLVPALIALIAIAAWFLRPRPLHGLELSGTEPVDFTLTAKDGERITLSNLRGKVVVLYFGYTYCPDACPTALATLSRAMKLLGHRADGVQVLMVTVDPERDTADALNAYVTQFDPRFIGLIGSPEELSAVATKFGIYYQAVKIESASGYTVDHTTTMTVVDKTGRTRLIFPLDTPPGDIASDLEVLLRE